MGPTYLTRRQPPSYQTTQLFAGVIHDVVPQPLCCAVIGVRAACLRQAQLMARPSLALHLYQLQDVVPDPALELVSHHVVVLYVLRHLLVGRGRGTSGN